MKRIFWYLITIALVVSATNIMIYGEGENDNVWEQQAKEQVLKAALTNDTSHIDTDPSVFQASNGTIYLFWEKYPEGTNDYTAHYCDIFMMVNNGSVWSNPTRITNNMSINKDPFAFQDDNGDIHLFFSSNRSGNYDIYEMINNGTGWSDAEKVVNNYYDDVDPCVLVCSDATIRLFWSQIENLSQPGYNSAEICQMTKNETGWSRPLNITSWPGLDLCPTAYQDSKGVLHLYWVRGENNSPFMQHTRHIYTMENYGTGWGPPMYLNTSTNDFAYRSTHVLYDSKDRIHLYVTEDRYLVPSNWWEYITCYIFREFIGEGNNLTINRTISSTIPLRTVCAFEDLNGTIHLFGEYWGEIYDLSNPLYAPYPSSLTEVNLTLGRNHIFNVTCTDHIIMWHTAFPSTSIVIYRLECSKQWYAFQDLTLTVNHTTSISSLEEGTYEFYIICTDAYNNTILDNNNGSYYTFTVSRSENVANEKQQQKGFIPSFETVALIAILGVCVILLRRRRC